LGRIVLAFRCFFNILFHGSLSDTAITTLGLSKSVRSAAVPAPPAPVARTSDGALQMLAILQRDSRLIDFLMEDVSAYEDDQIGAAVRSLHDQCRDSLLRYVRLSPVIDGVEGTRTNLSSAPRIAQDPAMVKFIGNVPAQPPSGGTLRHKGWRAEKVDLPPVPSRQDMNVIAPAEIEIE
jgi:hypothetical protein